MTATNGHKPSHNKSLGKTKLAMPIKRVRCGRGAEEVRNPCCETTCKIHLSFWHIATMCSTNEKFVNQPNKDSHHDEATSTNNQQPTINNSWTRELGMGGHTTSTNDIEKNDDFRALVTQPLKITTKLPNKSTSAQRFKIKKRYMCTGNYSQHNVTCNHITNKNNSAT